MEFKSKEALIHFEKAMIKELEDIFKNTLTYKLQIRGCYFHFAQSI